MKLRVDVAPFDVGSAKWKASCPDFSLVIGLGRTRAEARAHLFQQAEEMLVERVARTERLLAAVRKAKRRREKGAKR